jgi:hypothetical protein
MTATRWTLTLLAIAVVSAGLFFATREPAETMPDPAATPAATALPLNLPSAAPASAPAASAAPLAAAPASVAATAKPAFRVGSEGYGPHIERAQAGNDAAAAWEAVRWLRGCASVEQRRTSYELGRAHGAVPELMTQLMQEMDAEGRRCQTVTAQHRALLPELAARAMRAGITEAASAYAGAVFAGDLTPDERRDVADGMRRDAQAGDAMSLLNAALANEAWGLSDAERLAYLYAYSEMPGQPGNKAMFKSLLQTGSLRFKAFPSEEQQAAAERAGKQILERVRATTKP